MASEASAVTGSVTSAIGAVSQGQAQANSLNYAAQVQTQNAALDREAAQANASRIAMIGAQKIGTTQAAYGAAGVSAESGSVMNVIAMSHANNTLDQMNVLHGGEVKAINAENQASVDQLGAKSAINGSYFNALSSVMMGGSKIAGNSMGNGSTGEDETPEEMNSEDGEDAAGGAGDSVGAGEGAAEEGGAMGGGAAEVAALV